MTHTKLQLFIAGVLISMNSLLAQTSIADSLKQQLNAHPQEDTIKVNLLNNIAYEVRRSKPGTADSLIKLSIELADKLNYTKGKGYALALEGGRYYAKLKYKEGDSVFAISKQLLESVNDHKKLAYMLRTWANMKMDEGNHSQSLDYFLQGLKNANEAGDIKQAVDIKRTIG